VRFAEAEGRDVVSTASAKTIARVDALLVDAGTRRVAGLKLKKYAGDGDTLAWEDLHAFGRDVVTIDSTDGIRPAEGRLAELAGKDKRLVGKRLLEESGTELGKVEEVEFDPATGAVTTLLTSTEEIAGERLLGVGSYAVVVRRAT
jgi:sporulation protein YlmC with PRC-barrel domain